MVGHRRPRSPAFLDGSGGDGRSPAADEGHAATTTKRRQLPWSSRVRGNAVAILIPSAILLLLLVALTTTTTTTTLDSTVEVARVYPGRHDDPSVAAAASTTGTNSDHREDRERKKKKKKKKKKASSPRVSGAAKGDVCVPPSADCCGGNAYRPCCGPPRTVDEENDDDDDDDDDDDNNNYRPYSSKEAPYLRSRLVRLLQNRRIALVGDSLSRQWFETLSCFLGLEPVWFAYPSTSSSSTTAKKKDKRDMPSSLRNALEAADIKVPALTGSPPVGFDKARGYATTRPAPSTLLSFASSATETATEKGATPSSCVPLNVTVDYYKYNEGSSSLERLIRFLASDDSNKDGGPGPYRADAIVVNVGLHHKSPDRPTRPPINKDLTAAFRACGEVNARRQRRQRRHRTASPMCVVRETLPQHFDRPDGSGLYSDESYELRRCAPIRPNGTDAEALVRLYNAPIDDLATKIAENEKEAAVPVMRVHKRLVGAWKYHVDGDCTHFCHDVAVWGWVHEALAEALEVD